MAGTTWMVFDGRRFDHILGIRGRGIEMDIKQTETELPLQNGSKLRNVKLQNKKLRVNLFLEREQASQTIEDMKARLLQVLYTSGMEQLIFGDDPGHEWLGILSGTELIKESPDFAEIELSFTCDPIRRELSEIAYEDIDGKTFKNFGRDTHGVITFTLPSGRSSQVISLYGTIAKVTLAASDLAGEWRIDTEKREVYLNSVLSMLKVDFKNTNWLAPEGRSFCIPAGSFRFDFTPAVSGATIKYKRRCL